MRELEYHPIANIFPMESQDKLADLASDIKENGLLEPITLCDDKILDGRNRYEACRIAGCDFQTVVYDGDTPTAFVTSKNLKRRHLTPSQAAAAAVEALPHFEAEALNRKVLGGKAKDTQIIADAGESRAKAADQFGTNRQYVSDAKAIKKSHPDVFEDIRSGRKTIPKAKSELKAIKRNSIEQEQMGDIQSAPTISQSTAIEWLNKQSDVDLLLTDPPYQTDVSDISEFSKWLKPGLECVKKTGRAYVFIGAYPKEIAAYLSIDVPEHMRLANILVWTYRNTLGPSPKFDYKLNWQAILYFCGHEAEPLNCEFLVEQFSVQDIPAPDGRIGIRYHMWEKPILLAERLLRHSTKKGDLVIDPFVGTGTFLVAAARLGRLSMGCDNDKDMLGIAESRGCKWTKKLNET